MFLFLNVFTVLPIHEGWGPLKVVILLDQTFLPFLLLLLFLSTYYKSNILVVVVIVYFVFVLLFVAQNVNFKALKVDASSNISRTRT